ncbi:MAG: hypothetical protein JW864_12815 [Spirochaetes bacterium]|nr:hypothetical protein [Spirochaetota bacterium]
MTKKSIIRNYKIYSIGFGILVASAFRVIAPVFVAFKSPALDTAFTIMCFFSGIIVGLFSYSIGKITLVRTIREIHTCTEKLFEGD